MMRAPDGDDELLLLTTVDALLDEVTAAQKELFALAARPGSLPHTFAGLFAGPSRVSHRVAPYTQLAPRIRVSFAEPAELDVVVKPKMLGPKGAGAYPNTVEFRLSGGSLWLALEADMEWADFGAGRQYQLSIAAVPDRRVSGRAAVRLRRDDGSYCSIDIVKWTLSPANSLLSLAGEFDCGMPPDIDMRQKPILLLLFDTHGELQIRLDQIVASFA